jgi:hypothetical protein
MTHEGRGITEKTPAFMPNNNCLRGSKREAKLADAPNESMQK